MTHPYQIEITLPDGTQLLHRGLFIDGFDAILYVFDNFPTAKRIFPKRLPMTAPKLTCDELGVCQGMSAQDCPDCNAWECEVACSAPRDLPYYPFAPGVIEGPQGKDAPQGGFAMQVFVALAIVALACVGAVAAVAGFVMGYMNLAWVLP